MDGGVWWAAVHGVTRSRTQLSDFTFTFHFHALEKEMATHSSVLAWRIPGTGEPGGLPSVGSHRVRHDWSDLAAIYVNETICMVICPSTRFKLIILWARMNHLVPWLSQNAFWVLRHSFLSLTDCWWLYNIQLKTSRGVLFCPLLMPMSEAFSISFIL